MNAGNCLNVKSLNGVAVVSVPNELFRLHFVGATCTASARPGTGGHNSISLAKASEDEAIVALVITHRSPQKFVNDIRDGVILRLSWKNGLVTVHKDEDFVSPADRLAQVDGETYELQVTTHGQMFSLCRNVWGNDIDRSFLNKRQAYRNKGLRIVDDANLLCRYVINQASFEELEAAASDDLRSAEQIRYHELQTECQELFDENLGLEFDLSRLREECEASLQEFRSLNCRYQAEREKNQVLLTETEAQKQEIADLHRELEATLGARFRRLVDGAKAKWLKLIALAKAKWSQSLDSISRHDDHV